MKILHLKRVSSRPFDLRVFEGIRRSAGGDPSLVHDGGRSTISTSLEILCSTMRMVFGGCIF
jgi:hypothetical protein